MRLVKIDSVIPNKIVDELDSERDSSVFLGIDELVGVVVFDENGNSFVVFDLYDFDDWYGVDKIDE